MLTIDSERELPVPRIAFWGHKLVMREFHLRNRRGHESSTMAKDQASFQEGKNPSDIEFTWGLEHLP